MSYLRPYQIFCQHTGNQDFLYLTHLTRLVEKLAVTTSPPYGLYFIIYRVVYFLHEMTSLLKTGKSLCIQSTVARKPGMSHVALITSSVVCWRRRCIQWKWDSQVIRGDTKQMCAECGGNGAPTPGVCSDGRSTLASAPGTTPMTSHSTCAGPCSVIGPLWCIRLCSQTHRPLCRGSGNVWSYTVSP